MAEGGGTVVLRGDDNIVAPGHNGILMNDAGRDWLVCHYKDGHAKRQTHVANPLAALVTRRLARR